MNTKQLTPPESLRHDADIMEQQSYYSVAKRLRLAADYVQALEAVAEEAEALMLPVDGRTMTAQQYAVSAALAKLEAVRKEKP